MTQAIFVICLKHRQITKPGKAGYLREDHLRHQYCNSVCKRTLKKQTDMITSKLQQAVNDQITAELWSSNLYLQMSYYLKHMGWDGFAHWMKCHSDEEREHATRMADYLTDRGGQVKLQMVNLVPEGWGSVLEIFEHSLSQEKMVSKMIDKIVLHAIEEQDFATENFFRTFVDEQVEEEALFGGVVDRLKMSGDSALPFMDAQLGKRRE